MRYLGIVKRSKSNLVLPDIFLDVAEEGDYEAIEIGGDILLLTAPLDRERLKQIEGLASLSIEEHRDTLKRLAE